MSGPISNLTFVSSDIWMGEFRLAPDDPAWTRTNTINAPGPLIAFPRTTLQIRQEGKPAVVADPMRAVVYQAGQAYRRALVSADGDRCSYITFSSELAAEAAEPFDPVSSDREMFAFPFVAANVGSAEYVRNHCARREVASGEFDHDEIRESLYWLVSQVVASGYGLANGRRSAARQSTTTAHDETVEGVRAAVGTDFERRLSLDDFAKLAHMSPFHLSRVFRERTGRSIHGYRTELRLRAALGPISDGESLAAVAAAFGFASQAHLTDRFRRAFGDTPHAWRTRLASPSRGRETRRIVESAAVRLDIA